MEGKGYIALKGAWDWDIVDKTVTIPTYEGLKAAHEKREIKAQRQIPNVVKDQ